MNEHCPGSLQPATAERCPECRRKPAKRQDGTWGLHRARNLQAPSELEQSLLTQLAWAKLPAPEREYRFHPTRDWRSDMAWPDALLLVEVDGGGWVGGKHGRGAGIEKDAEKQSTAAAAGWRTMRFTKKMIESGLAVALIEEALTDPSDIGQYRGDG